MRFVTRAALAAMLTLGGYFSGAIDLGGGALASAGSEDASLAKFGL